MFRSKLCESLCRAAGCPSPSISRRPARTQHCSKAAQEIEPIGVRHELVVLHVLGDFFVATMQETDIWCRLGNNLAIEFEHESQHAMRSRVRRAHIEDHFFADIVIGVMPLRIRCYHSRHRVSRFNLTRRERHEKSYKVKRLQGSKRITFTLASGPAHASNFGWVAHAFRVSGGGVSPSQTFPPLEILGPS